MGQKQFPRCIRAPSSFRWMVCWFCTFCGELWISYFIFRLGLAVSWVFVRTCFFYMLITVRHWMSVRLQVILSDSYDTALRRWDTSGKRIVGDQQFWFAIGMTTLCDELNPNFMLWPTSSSSVLLPWLTVRKVHVDIELVRFQLQLSALLLETLINFLAVTKGGYSSVRMWDAARPAWSHKSIFNYGIPCFRYHQVTLTSHSHGCASMQLFSQWRQGC